MIAIATGAVTTLAGSAGESGSADGVGHAARFYAPGDVALSADGTFALVADTGNQTIRKIDVATAAVTTLAGNPAVSGSADGTGAAALFAYPTSIALSADNAFALVTDTDNQTIRKVMLATGIVTTQAGIPGVTGNIDGSANRATFNKPSGVTMSGGDHPFALVTDRSNSTIRRIDLTTGIVTTLAGVTGEDADTDGTNAQIRFNLPTGIALSADGTRALVADTGSQALRAITLDSEEVKVTTFALTTLSGNAGQPGMPVALTMPIAVALSANGERGLVVDSASSTLALIDVERQSAQVLGVADEGPAPTDDRLNAPEGVAISSDGRFAVIANTINQTIRKLSLSSGATTVIAGHQGVSGSADGVGIAATFAYPVGIALSPDNRMALVADRDNHTIRRIDLASGQVTTLAGMAGVPGSHDGIGAAAQFTRPQGVAISGDGTFAVVTDSFNHSIRRIDLITREVTTLAGTPEVPGSHNGVGTAASFNLPFGVTLCAQGGYALITDTGNNTIRKLILATREVSTVAGTAGTTGSTDGSGGAVRFAGPSGITINADCTQALVADSYNHTLRQIDIATGQVTTMVGLPRYFGSADGLGVAVRFDTPTGVAMTANGKLALVADTGNATIRYVGDHYFYMPLMTR
jgi:DNA-binding beta-propeller fold protein YncE